MNESEKTIKQNHKEDICLFKIGTFYHCYNKDAYIISYLFDYKIKSIKQNVKECGFPLNSLERVVNRLAENKINYIIIDNEEENNKSKDYGELNNYNSFYIKSNTCVNYKSRIENITNFLLESMEEKDFRKMLEKIEEIIYDE